MKIFEILIENAKRHYIFTLIILWLGIFISYYVVSLTNWGFVFSGIIISILILIMTKFIGCINVFGLKKNNILRSLGSSFPIFCVGICSLILSLLYINHIGFSEPNYYSLSISIIWLFGVALFEEIFMRGIILNILIRNCKKDKLFLIIVSAIIFGISHLYKLIDGIENLVWAIPQVLYATIIGIFLSIIYLKYNNMWSIVIIHFLFNSMGIIPFYLFSSPENFIKLHSIIIIAVIDVLIFIPCLVYSLFMYKNMGNKRENGI
jgi:membrane protease YdiL (CAAX protease family)